MCRFQLLARFALPLALSILFLWAPFPRRASGAEPTNDGLENLYDALVFNAKVFLFDPKYQRELADAVEAERMKLKAGEFKQFRILEKNGPDEDLKIFVGLEDVAQPSLRAADTHVAEGPLVTIRKAEYAFLAPLIPVTRVEYERAAKLSKTDKGRATYEDYVFAVQASNHLSGIRQSFQLQEVEKAHYTFAREEFVSLKDPNAYAADAGTVILVSVKGETNYSVYDIDSKRSSIVSKGDAMKTAGNSLYLLIKSIDGSEYTVVYKHLHGITTKLGTAVSVGDVIASLPQEREGRPSIEIWRVHGREQRFIKGTDKSNGPYSVWKR